MGYHQDYRFRLATEFVGAWCYEGEFLTLEPWMPHGALDASWMDGWTGSGRVQVWQRPNCELYSVCAHITPSPSLLIL